MRLGLYDVDLLPGTRVSELYGTLKIRERHRHRFEVNPDYIGRIKKEGLDVSGTFGERKLVEVVEIPSHPFYVASQFHPEFRSRPLSPHPLFSGFLQASLRHAKGKRPPQETL